MTNQTDHSSPRTVTATGSFPGQTAYDMESVALKVETAAKALPGIQRIESSSFDGRVRVTLRFAVDAELIESDIRKCFAEAVDPELTNNWVIEAR